ncbi:MAG TPA: GMC oxidoreductase, partial [Rhabdochlamydiaceae bacterium]|nr:GMC oxidoreductase [Rhabdochlamydiaceae bacterium]
MLKLITAAVVALFSMHTLQASSGVKGNRADYVIVGVGTAGSLLAKKLTDDKKTSVIALHSGKNLTGSFIVKYGRNTIFSVLSSLFGIPLNLNPASLGLPPELQKELEDFIQLTNTTAKPLYETGLSTPQPNALDREILWAIGFPEGGGSSINAGAWARGTNQVYSQWEAIAGPSWSVNRILNIYKKLEDYHGKTTNSSVRGHDGPLYVLQDSPVSPLAKVFSQAIATATGYPLVLDYNDPNTPIGVSEQFQLTRRSQGNGGFYRVSGATAFLNENVVKSDGKGVDGRKLKVHFNSMGLRTIWQGNRAVGVEYMQEGKTKRVYANKGVIVCAGLRSSPFLLHSGVGPASLLNSLGIPVIYDNPEVGQGLTDQEMVPILFTSNPKDSVAGSTNRAFSQISWLPVPGGDPTSRQIRIATIDIIPGLTPALVDLIQPQSRGSVSINSANPLDPPVIDLGVLSNPNDLNTLVSAFQVYIKDINTQLQATDPKYELILPPAEILDDPVLIQTYIMTVINSNMCFQSHCRIGAVVDSNGRVFGVQNLIVADNSINPAGMDGTPMASGYLVAANIA